MPLAGSDEGSGLEPFKPETELHLSESFSLPEGTRKMERRIPHAANYPPVIDYLFAKRFDPDLGTMTDPTISFSDVEEAIEKTGVNLRWVRADTFLSDLSRSRNLGPILRTCRSKGFTLARPRGPDGVAEFVPIGTYGAIDDRYHSYQVRRSRGMPHLKEDSTRQARIESIAG